eukprot:6012549-Amphidinium_carterae.1
MKSEIAKRHRARPQWEARLSSYNESSVDRLGSLGKGAHLHFVERWNLPKTLPDKHDGCQPNAAKKIESLCQQSTTDRASWRSAQSIYAVYLYAYST